MYKVITIHPMLSNNGKPHIWFELAAIPIRYFLFLAVSWKIFSSLICSPSKGHHLDYIIIIIPATSKHFFSIHVNIFCQVNFVEHIFFLFCFFSCIYVFFLYNRFFLVFCIIISLLFRCRVIRDKYFSIKFR